MASSQGRPIDINACNDLCRVYNYTLKCLELKCSAESLQRRFNVTNETLPWTSAKEIFTTVPQWWSQGCHRRTLRNADIELVCTQWELQSAHLQSWWQSGRSLELQQCVKDRWQAPHCVRVISKLHQVYSAINDNSQNHFSRHRQIVDGSVII